MPAGSDGGHGRGRLCHVTWIARKPRWSVREPVRRESGLGFRCCVDAEGAHVPCGAAAPSGGISVAGGEGVDSRF